MIMLGESSLAVSWLFLSCYIALIALYTSLHPWGCLLREQAGNTELVLSESKSRHAYCYLQKIQFPEAHSSPDTPPTVCTIE